jgi:hypothetical protein
MAADSRLHRFSTNFPSLAKTRVAPTSLTTLLITVLLFAISSVAQQTSTPAPPADSQPSQDSVASANAASPLTAVTVPAGTSIALVLTHPIQSRHIHHGDHIYAQIISPVTTGNQAVIPPGTLVQGKVDSIGRNGSRGELRLQSMSIMFPDGYVAPVAGPLTLQSDEGYAIKDPGQGRMLGAFAFPAAGAGLGALIGHSAASSQGTTITSTLPPGCTGPPPGCLSSSLTGPPEKGKDTVIGAAVGGAVGAVASIALLVSSHNFFLDVGSPVEMVLQHPLSLQQDQVAEAIQQSEQHPVPEQPVVPRPRPPVSTASTDPGTCYTPGTPGTPDIDIPGTPAIGDSPGTPAIHIPGIPATPPIPHPCP